MLRFGGQPERKTGLNTRLGHLAIHKLPVIRVVRRWERDCEHADLERNLDGKAARIPAAGGNHQRALLRKVKKRVVSSKGKKAWLHELSRPHHKVEACRHGGGLPRPATLEIRKRKFSEARCKIVQRADLLLELLRLACKKRVHNKRRVIFGSCDGDHTVSAR